MIVPEDVLSYVSSAGNMVAGVLILDAERSGHRIRYQRSGVLSRIKI
jgi:hypothetical protein